MPPLDLVLPHPADLLVLLLVWTAGAVFLLVGRLLTAGRGQPELQFLAGWGAYCLVLTVWGLATGASMRIPAWCFVVAALLALALPSLRPTRADLATILRVMALSLPLWLLLATARASLPDSFTNFWPNAVYVFDHGTFPADDRIANISIWPALPYNLSLVGLLAALPLQDFPPSILTLFNVLLFAACGVMLARLIAPVSSVPSWGAMAGGLLLATAINPGFVPKYDFSSYGDGASAVAFAAGGWLAVRLLGRLAAGEAHRTEGVLYGFVLAALVNIKESDIALTGILIVGPVLLAAGDRAVGWRRAAPLFLFYAMPGIATYVAWRAYVMTRIPGGELNLMPLADWHLSVLPLVLLGMLRTMVQKAYLFAAVILAVALAWRWLRRQKPDETARLLALFALAFLLYNGFLLFTYIAHFAAPDEADAHSYFRYMTHLSLLLMMALTASARDLWRQRAGRPSMPRWLAPAAIIALLAVPLATISWLRFDLEMPYPLLQSMAQEAAGLVQDGDRVALLLPRDNGSLAVLLKAELTLLPPRRPNLDLATRTTADPETLQEVAQAGYRFALLSCTPGGMSGVPPGHAALLEHGTGGWRPIKDWSYPDPARSRRWTAAVSGEPLCRSR